MVPVRMSSIFKNRWIALLWAGGIVWSAVDYVGSQPSDSNAANGAEDTASIQAAANALDAMK